MKNFGKLRRFSMLLFIGFVLNMCIFDTVYADEPKSSEYEEAKECVTAYYEAFSEGDTEKANELWDDADTYIKENREYGIRAAKACGMESYEPTDISGYPVGDKGEKWLFIVTVEMKIKGIGVGLPGLESLLVCKKDGNWRLCSDTSAEEMAEVREILEREDIADKNNECRRKYNDIVHGDSGIEEWLLKLEQAIEDERLGNTDKKTETVKESNYENYVVRQGDCLWSIAKDKLGDGMRWIDIYEANENIIGENPDLILPDMVLKLP